MSDGRLEVKVYGAGELVPAFEVLVERHGVELRRFPPEVMRAMVEAANEVVAESAGKGGITRRVYDSWSRFRTKVVALAPLTELGYMSIRTP